MKYEFRKIIKNKLLIVILLVNILISTLQSYFDNLYRPEEYWINISYYWDKVGVIFYFLIITVVLVMELTKDRDVKIEDIIISTKKGRYKNFLNKNITIAFSSLILGVILISTKVIIGNIFSKNISSEISEIILYRSMVAIAGAMGLSVFMYNLVDLTRNFTVTFIISSFLFINNFLLRGSLLDKFSFLNLLENGFYAEMMRGLSLESWDSYFWVVYHIIITLGIFAINNYKKRGDENANRIKKHI